jgi:hypothetical protein
MLDATPLNANLSTPATTANEAAQTAMNNNSNLNPTIQNSELEHYVPMIRTHGLLRVAADDLFSGVMSHDDQQGWYLTLDQLPWALTWLQSQDREQTIPSTRIWRIAHSVRYTKEAGKQKFWNFDDLARKWDPTELTQMTSPLA